MRQGEKDDVVPGEDLGGGRLQDPVGERPEMGLQGAELLPRVGVAGEGPDLDLGVNQQQTEQLPMRRIRSLLLPLHVPASKSSSSMA